MVVHEKNEREMFSGTGAGSECPKVFENTELDLQKNRHSFSE